MCDGIIKRKGKRMKQKKYLKQWWLKFSQSTNPRGLENTRKNKCQRENKKRMKNNSKNYTYVSYSNCKKSKVKINFERSQRKKILHAFHIQRNKNHIQFIEIMQARGKWNKVFKVIRLLKIQSKIMYPEKLSFKGGREIDFPNKYWGNLLPIHPPSKKCYMKFFE